MKNDLFYFLEDKISEKNIIRNTRVARVKFYLKFIFPFSKTFLLFSLFDILTT